MTRQAEEYFSPCHLESTFRRQLCGVNVMKKLPLIIAVVCFLLAVAVFVFAEGPRAIYSGLFFAMIGVVVLWTAKRKAGGNAP